MGAKVSRTGIRLIRKPLETQRQVEKILETKPRPAPRHPSSKSALVDEETRNKELFKERDRKDDSYVDRLKDFKIESVDVEGPAPITGDFQTKRMLPQSREQYLPREIGKAPKGKITPAGLSQLFAHRLQDPDKWTVEKLAEHYQLDKADVAALLKYYSDYAVVDKRDYPRPQDDVTFIG